MKVAVFGCLLLCGLLLGVIVAAWPPLPEAPAPIVCHTAPPPTASQSPPARAPRISRIPPWFPRPQTFDDPPVKDRPAWDDCPELSTWTNPRVCRAWI